MSNAKKAISKKLVIVGDGACGKTSLLIVHNKGEFPQVYIPTVFDDYTSNIIVDGKIPVKLHLWDTAGQEEYERLRPLAYPDSNVILICFALDSRDSLENVSFWLSEVLHFCQNIPLFLVACKKDLRTDQNTLKRLSRKNQSPISYDEGKAVADKYRFYEYVECSAKTGENVNSLFESAARSTLNIKGKGKKRKNSDKSCVVL